MNKHNRKLLKDFWSGFQRLKNCGIGFAGRQLQTTGGRKRLLANAEDLVRAEVAAQPKVGYDNNSDGNQNVTVDKKGKNPTVSLNGEPLGRLKDYLPSPSKQKGKNWKHGRGSRKKW